MHSCDVCILSIERLIFEVNLCWAWVSPRRYSSRRGWCYRICGVCPQGGSIWVRCPRNRSIFYREWWTWEQLQSRRTDVKVRDTRQGAMIGQGKDARQRRTRWCQCRRWFHPSQNRWSATSLRYLSMMEYRWWWGKEGAHRLHTSPYCHWERSVHGESGREQKSYFSMMSQHMQTLPKVDISCNDLRLLTILLII